MGKSKTKTSNKVDPWIPDQATFDEFRGYGGSLMTDRFVQGLAQAQSTLGAAAGQAGVNPAVRSTLMSQMQGGTQSDPRFNAVTGRNAPGPTQGFNREVSQAMNAGVNPLLSRAAQGAQGGPAQSIGQAVGRTMGARVDQGLNQATGRAINAGLDPRFNQGVAQATQGGFDQQFNRATTQAQRPQYARGFQRTINELTDQNARSAAFDQVKRNVADDVLQDVNATFGASGMTGSSLHQQNLAKGLTSGIASVENEAFQQMRDRALQAAQVGQQDLQQQRQMGLGAAQARQSARDTLSGRQLQGAGMVQDAQNALRSQAVQAAGVRNDAQNALRAQQLQAAGLQQDALTSSRGQALQGAGQLQDAQNAIRAQGLQAANMQQSALANQYGQNLQAAGMRQDAFNADQARAFQSANALQGAQQQQFGNLLGLSSQQAGLGQQYQGAYQGAVQGLMGAATGGASQSSTQSQSPGLMGILGAGLQVASLFSDERLKTDAKKVGKLDDGTPVYTYKYKDGAAPEGLEGKTLMGVMAQQVKNKKAVEDDPSGFKRVNYGAL